MAVSCLFIVQAKCFFVLIDYCLFGINRKDVLCLAFDFKGEYIVLIDHILSETICLFCFCVLFSNIYPYIKFTKFTTEIGLTYAVSIVKWWGFFCLRKYRLVFFAAFKLWIFDNSIVKISENMNKRNMLKICLQITYPKDVCIICIHFYYGKKWQH